jgi:carboxylesterase type B
MSSEDFPVIDTEYGPVKGIKSLSVLNSEYFSFRGIPYMKSPLGKLRFREAQSPRSWSDVFDATQEGPSYVMTDYMTGKKDGQENAGTINVFTKDLKPKKLLPVMIWVI